MKILIQSTNGGAHKFINLGLSRALTALGYETFIWDSIKISPYDIFDKIKPDVFLGQTYNLSKSLIKLISENPLLKVGLRASDRSRLANEVAGQYPILKSSEEEIRLVNTLRDSTGKPTFLHNHYTQDSINLTHEDWIKDGYNVVSLLNAADLFDYTRGEYRPEFESDLCFVGGYWPYKAITLDQYILNLYQNNYKMKIFGNQAWPGQYYCGEVKDEFVKHIFSSSKICLNIHERHSQQYGYDIIERPFKLLSNKCFCISDLVKDLTTIIPNGIVYTENPSDFKDKINYYLKNPDEKQTIIDSGHDEVIKNHTYFDRAKVVLDQFKLPILSDLSINQIKEKLI